jgi:stage V sporulation protein B
MDNLDGGFTIQEKKNSGSKFARGALILLIGGVICKLIGAFYRIPLSNILGAEGIGIYQLIFPIYSLFLVVASGGIPVALSKVVAECRARGEQKRAKRFLIQSLILLIIISTIFSLVFILFGSQIAGLQGNLSAGLGYITAAVAIFFASVLTAFRGYFQGYQNMTPTAVSQIVEQTLKLILGLLFASFFVNYGIEYGVFGAMLGISISEVAALIYLAILFIIKRRKIDLLEPELSTNFGSDFKYLLKKSFPITLNAIVLPFILAIDSFMIVNLLLKTGFAGSISTQMFGVYSGMVNSLINLPTIVSMVLAISLIPSISYSHEKGEDISKSLSSTIKIILLVSIPSIFMYFTFSREIIAILYPHATNAQLVELGALLLRITAVNIFYISLLQVTTAILQASNKVFIPLINLVFSGVVKVILTIVFVLSPLNIYGAAIASVMCFGLASGLNLIALKNEFNFAISAKKTLYIFISSAATLGIAIGFNLLFNIFFSQFLSIIFSFGIAVLSYLIMVIFLPIFEDEEISKVPFGHYIVVFREKVTFKFKRPQDKPKV